MSRTVTDPQPILFFCWLGLGLLSLLASILALLLHPEILIGAPAMSPMVMAWTHLMILGWLCSLFFAAGYQLIPVVTLNPIGSRWLSRFHFVLHLLGMPVMVVAFATGRYHWLAVSGSAVILGMVLFGINNLLSAGSTARWNHVSIPWFMAVFWMMAGAALALLAVFMRLGSVDSANFQAILGLHIHTMVGGFFLLILIAAASKLVPMFMLAPEKPQYGTWIATILINTVLFAAHFRMGEHPVAYRTVLTWITLLALLAYFGQLLYFAVKKRRDWDAGMVLFYAANLLLLPAWWFILQFHQSSPADALASQDLLRAGLFLCTFVVFGGCILGMAQKIVPFMLWHHLYAKYLGKAKVPQTIELLNSWTLWPIAVASLLAATGYVVAFLIGSTVLIQAASVAMMAAFLLMLCNAPQVRRHWRNPQVTPFPKSSPTTR